jgi:hypothetical protein
MIKNKFIVPIVAIIFVLVLLLSVLTQKDAKNDELLLKSKENADYTNRISGFAVHSSYPEFSAANSGFIFNNISSLVSVNDTVVYKFGYYSINGTAWQNFTLAGTGYNGDVNWLSNNATCALPVFGVGEHYVIVYSCTYNLSNISWNCYENRWQLIVINNTPIPNCSDNIKNQNEVFTDCGGVCPACECLTSQTQSCNITNGAGTQTRNCTDGRYSLWGLCTVVSCNSGYVISGNSCVLNSSNTTWSNELMINGGFETGNLTGWTTSGSGWVVGFNQDQGEYNPPQAGSYCAYFDLYSSTINYYIYQDVNLTSYANYIDVGTVLINVSGWGVSTNYDPAPWDLTRIQFIFLNSAKGVISTPKDTGYINNPAWWKTNLSEYSVPVNTRYVRVWGNTYESGNQPSGNLDSFSVKIKSGPCIDTCASLGYTCGSVCGVNCGSYNGGCQTGYYCALDYHCTACTTHASSSCYNGDVYWYDSCGTRETIRYDCNSTQTCSSGVCVNNPPVGTAIIIDHTTTNVSKIPLSCINKVKSDLHIAYSHTSHGSQIYSGMQALETQNSLYSMDFNVVSGQLHFEDYYGYGDQSGFATGGCYDLSACDDGGDGLLGPTREFLDSPNGADINVILWSWCSIAGHNIPFYLSTMQTAITEYPDVKFVFITGHAEGGGEGDSSDSRNNVIRDFVNNNAFCDTHQCILFDFADMENYDPDNNYFLDKYVTDALNYDGGNWGLEYLTRHPTGLNADLTTLINYDCAHSSSPYEANVNCALKAQAAWYMFARMVGWDGNPSNGC